jgi:branched-chain amino acid transport system ATP-binding protein
MLQVQSLQKSFGGFMAVVDANLTIEKGDIVAVIGPNGAGKTTLFNLITGQLKPNAGRVVFKGQDIAGRPPYHICKMGISRSFQIVNIFHRMTVFENVQIAVLTNLKKSLNFLLPARNLAVQRTEALLDSVGLMGKRDRISGTLSHGDQKVLEIAIALGTEPELLILDEPTAGMSPEETAITIKLIQKLSSELGLTILFCEHDMGLVFTIATKIMVMQQGQTIIQGDPATVRADKRVQEAYLGGGA